jgi:hypothetical protein
MAPDPAKDNRVIAAYLDDVDLDLDATRRLIADPPNRLAAFHLQQAAEKLVKAVRLSRGLRLTKEHSIEISSTSCHRRTRGERSSSRWSRSPPTQRRIATRRPPASARTD